MFEPLAEGVVTQLEARKNLLGATNRSIENLQYQNSNTGWVRLISSVNTEVRDPDTVTGNPFQTGPFIEIGNPDLAKNYIISGPVSFSNGTFKLKAGLNFDSKDPSTLYDYEEQLGVRPSPGITSFSVISKNRFGTIREANIGFVVWSKADIDQMEKLYFRPGFSSIVEWGHSIYVDNSTQGIVTAPEFNSNFSAFFEENDFQGIINLLNLKKQKFSYNYDSLIGFIKNFSWSFRPDGGYDCSVSIISLGEVLESISMKLPPVVMKVTEGTIETAGVDNENIFTLFRKEILNAYSDIPDPESRPNGVTDFTEVSAGGAPITVPRSSGTMIPLKQISLDLLPVTGTLLVKELKKINTDLIATVYPSVNTDTGKEVYITLRTLLGIVNSTYIPYHKIQKCDPENKLYSFNVDLEQNRNNYYLTTPNHFSLDPRICILPKKITDIPIPDSINISFFRGKRKNFKDIITPNALQDNLIRLIDKSINSNTPETNSTAITAQNILVLPEELCLNILVNLEYIETIAKNHTSQTEDELQFSVIGFIKDILSGINNALGGINEISLENDEDTLTYKVVDRKVTPTSTDPRTSNILNQIQPLELTGVRSLFSNISIQSKITNKLSSTIAIAAQGKRDTGIGKYKNTGLWHEYNKGLIDRFSNDVQIGIPKNCLPDTSTEEKKVPTTIWQSFLNVLRNRPVIRTFRGIYNYLTRSDQITTISFETYDLQELGKFYLLASLQYYGFIREEYRNFQLSINKTISFDGIVSIGGRFMSKVIEAENLVTCAPSRGIIPIELSFTTRGIGGLKIGQTFTLKKGSTVPASYNDYGFIITGLEHTVTNNIWETQVRAQTYFLKSPEDCNDVIGGSYSNASSISSGISSGGPFTVSGCTFTSARPSTTPFSNNRYSDTNNFISISYGKRDTLQSTSIQVGVHTYRASDFIKFDGPYTELDTNSAPLNTNLLALLEALNSRLGVKVNITNGYRTLEQNQGLKNAATNSYHLYGMALDIQWPDADTSKLCLIARTAYELGTGGIGIYPRHIHIDVGRLRQPFNGSY